MVYRGLPKEALTSAWASAILDGTGTALCIAEPATFAIRIARVPTIFWHLFGYCSPHGVPSDIAAQGRHRSSSTTPPISRSGDPVKTWHRARWQFLAAWSLRLAAGLWFSRGALAMANNSFDITASVDEFGEKKAGRGK